MKKVIGLVILIGLLAVACGGGPAGGPGAAEGGEPTAAVAEGEVQLAPELSVYNWADYIDEQILADYTERYGVEIIYDTFASNEDLLTKLQAGASGYDIIIPSDYMVAQMIELGLLAEIDVATLPNFANIGAEFKDPPYDPGNAHCTPYQWGMTGIGYRNGNPAFADGPPNSWAYLFEPSLLEQTAPEGINVLNDQRELMAAALFFLGHSPNSTDRAELEAARDLILQAKPYWKTFNSEDYYSTLMESDEIILSHAWSGDAAQAFWSTYDDATGEGNWLFTVPVEGAVRYQDNVCIPANSQRIETALHFMNYLMEAEVAAAITNFTFYPSPNEAAKEFINPDILNNPGIFPPPEVAAKLQWLTDVGDAIFIYDEMWTAIKGQ
ncbi:Extracellular solute-binding protein [Candidatus Promineifilum breve]|uniref:Extracellular solute-binding protein n=1 Tax=Candidatus Promineifilum breve TaxID=1806508 RepID=A0A160T1P1_9CHLR|nr:spermidine/putrescine ABC transporter substrate-binding protein [Candidatus Promineifilum breve]CUS03961.2 Extracellular solute-binding protein [Candidatus Promineifilum breve]